MTGLPLRVVKLDPPQPAWLSFQPGGWVATEVFEWQLRADGWWAEITLGMNGHPQQRTWVRAEQLRVRTPIRIGRTHRCNDPP